MPGANFQLISFLTAKIDHKYPGQHYGQPLAVLGFVASSRTLYKSSNNKPAEVPLMVTRFEPLFFYNPVAAWFWHHIVTVQRLRCTANRLSRTRHIC
jgi:hypothetical protein